MANLEVENHKTVVKYTVRFVRNLGNYESLHVEVGIEDQTRDGESVPEAYNRVKRFVNKKFIEEVNELDEQLGGANGGY